MNLRKEPSPRAVDEKLEVKNTTCYMCACRCGIRVLLRDGEVRYIDGNPEHPLNGGVICAKGASGAMKQYSPARLTKPLMQELKLHTRSACDISADEVPKAKPAPDGILRACELLALSPTQCIYVGDDKRDIDAGHAAGMKTIAADWGYLGDNGPIESWQADAIAATPADLGKYVL